MRSFVTLFGIIGGHTALETARDTLFLETLAADRLTLAYMALALVGFVVPAYNLRFVRRLGRRNAVVFTLMLAAFGTTLLHFQPVTPAAVFAIYLWSGLLATVMVVQFWLFVGQLFTVAQGKRLFGPIAAGGVLGATAGGAASAALLVAAPWLSGAGAADDPAGARGLLLVAAGFFLFSAVVLTTIDLDDASAPPPGATARRDDQPTTRQAGKREQSYALRVGVLVALSTAALLTVDYLFKLVAKQSVPAASLGQFFALFYTALNIVALAAQLLVAPLLVRRLGVVASLGVLPLFLLGGAGAIALLGGGFVAVLLAKGADGSLRHSLHRVSAELLYLALPPGPRDRSKSVHDSVVVRTTQAVMAGAILLLASTGWQSVRLLAGIVAGLTASWLVAAWLLKRPYVDLFRRSLSRTALDSARLADLDLDSAESAMAALSSTEPERVVAAMELLAEARRTRLIPALVLYHESEQVLVRALELLPADGRDDWIPHAERLLEHEVEGVAASAVRALGRANIRAPVEQASHSGRSAVRGHAAFHVARWDETRPPEQHPLIAPLLRDDHERGSDADEQRASLVHALRDDADERWSEVLLALARQHHGVAIDEVALAIARIGDERFVPALLERLGERAGRGAVREALQQLGPPALAALEQALIDPHTERRVRLHVPRTIARFGSQRAADVLLAQLDRESQGDVRYKVLRGLGRLFNRHDVVMPPRAIYGHLRATLGEYLRLQALWLPLDRQRQTEDLPSRARDTGRLLTGLLEDKLRQALERAFRLLQLVHRNEDVRNIHAAFRSGDRHAKANALEFLDALLADSDGECRRLMHLVVDDLSAEQRLARAGSAVATPPRDAEQALAQLLQEPDAAMAALAACHARASGEPDLLDALDSDRRPSLALLLGQSGPRGEPQEIHGN